MYNKKTFLRQFSLLLLSASLFLGGCTQSAKTPESKAESTHPSEPSALSSQEQFEQLIQDLFYDSVNSSGLTMHSMLSDPTVSLTFLIRWATTVYRRSKTTMQNWTKNMKNSCP